MFSIFAEYIISMGYFYILHGNYQELYKDLFSSFLNIHKQKRHAYTPLLENKDYYKDYYLSAVAHIAYLIIKCYLYRLLVLNLTLLK